MTSYDSMEPAPSHYRPNIGTHSAVRTLFVNDYGNATPDGIFNLLDVVIDVTNGKAAWIKNGNYSYNFANFGGNNAVAKAVGISEEVLLIILNAGTDVGFR